MNPPFRRSLLLLLIVGLAIAGPVAASAVQDSPGAAEVEAEADAVEPSAEAAPAPAGFTRRADPVIIRGEQFPGLLGAREEEIRVFAGKGEHLEPIPYQMDERNPWGEFVLARGKGVVPDDDEGRYDENDEIVFLTGDLGRRFPKEAWQGGHKLAAEVEVIDPLNSAKAYAYIMRYEDASAPPPPSTKDYMQYEEKGDGLIRGRNYELGWLKTTSGMDYNHLAVLKAAGGDDINHFDKLKIRVMQNIKRYFLFGLTTRLDKTEENFLVKVFGYKDGPVRVLRVMKVNLQLVWKLPAPGATVNYVFYPEWIEIPVPINLPFKPTWAFYNIELDTSHDYAFKPTDGVKGFNSKDPDNWTSVDGKMSPEEVDFNKQDLEGAYAGYDASASGAGAAFFTVRPPRSFSTRVLGLYLDDPEIGVEPEYYKGDGKKKNRHEWRKGSSFMGGFRFIEWGGVGRGIHTVYYYQFYPPHYEPGKEKAFLDIIDHPISVTLN